MSKMSIHEVYTISKNLTQQIMSLIHLDAIKSNKEFQSILVRGGKATNPENLNESFYVSANFSIIRFPITVHFYFDGNDYELSLRQMNLVSDDVSCRASHNEKDYWKISRVAFSMSRNSYPMRFNDKSDLVCNLSLKGMFLDVQSKKEDMFAYNFQLPIVSIIMFEFVLYVINSSRLFGDGDPKIVTEFHEKMLEFAQKSQADIRFRADVVYDEIKNYLNFFNVQEIKVQTLDRIQL